MKKRILFAVAVLGMYLANILFSEQPLPPGDGGGGSFKSLGYWENYGSITLKRLCREIIYEYRSDGYFVYKVVIREVNVYF